MIETYTFKMFREKVGYSVFCSELDGCQTQGDTKEELLNNIKEALEVYLNVRIESISNNYAKNSIITKIKIIK